MSESDGIDEAIEGMSRIGMTVAGRLGEQLARARAKAAILGFTKALARETGDTGVTVNAITPGAVETDICVGSIDEQEAAVNAGIPVGRNATTEEIAPVITFLPRASPPTSPEPPLTSMAEATFTSCRRLLDGWSAV